ncbi:metallophosphoesterase [Candidatus Woesearchaeota archaeon]|nr:metallophosphoesterase [Candidatus Woesearchaeota archaeon]
MKYEKEIQSYAEKGFLVNPELLDKLEDIDEEKLFSFLNEDLVVINKDLVKSIEENKIKKLNWLHFDEARVIFEKNGYDEEYDAFLNILFEKKIELNGNGIDIGLDAEEESGGVVVLKNFDCKSKKLSVDDFVLYFNNRYKCLKEILSSRIELREAVSINRVLTKNDERIALIGIVNEKRITKNDNLLIELEDMSGKINLLINKNKPELKDSAKEIILDEVIGVVGNISNGFVFVDKFFFPDIPLIKELKKSNNEEFVVFISDLHVGSKYFLEKDFLNFLEWIRSKEAENVKYLFIVGDLIEGVGIYPGQENDLAIKDYRRQYEKFAELLKIIPEKISIILCPGNHDALRLDEPQPAINKEFLGELLKRENIFSVSNPAFVNIGAGVNFPGFDILLYHGGSFTFYADSVENIRLNGGLHNPGMIMKFLLKKRHLAPTHTSTSYIAGSKDLLVIDKVPDFFISGHIHRCSFSNYNNVTLLNCGCWFPQSDYQEKRGLEPEPSRAIIVNLKTRGCEIKYFGDESK